MNDQFKRMQKLAGLITEGMGAYEYEKGKEAGEKIEKKKMKKSELKKQIKEMILAEMDIDITNDADFYDPVYETKNQTAEKLFQMFKDEDLINDRREYDIEDLISAYPGLSKEEATKLFDMLQNDLDEAKKKKDEEEVEDITVDDTEISTEMPAEPVSPSYDVQKELMDALEAAKSIGDEKLVRQIGNALTYFTRTQVADKEAPTMSEGIEDTDVSEEAYDRMNGLVNQNDLKNFIDSASNMMRDLTDEGFEPVEVFYYLYTRLTANV